MTKQCPKYGKAIYLQCQECEEKLCEDKRFYCLIVGTRTYTNYVEFKSYVDKILCNKVDQGIVVVSGGASGTDKMAERYANEHNYALKVVEADWNRFKNSAGYIRNEEMHKFISGFKDRGCIAFWDEKSKGTQHSFTLAKKYKNMLRVVHI